MQRCSLGQAPCVCGDSHTEFVVVSPLYVMVRGFEVVVRQDRADEPGSQSGFCESLVRDIDAFTVTIRGFAATEDIIALVDCDKREAPCVA